MLIKYKIFPLIVPSIMMCYSSPMASPFPVYSAVILGEYEVNSTPVLVCSAGDPVHRQASVSQPSHPWGSAPSFQPFSGPPLPATAMAWGVRLQSYLWPCLLQLLPGSPRWTLDLVPCLLHLVVLMDPAAIPGFAQCAQPLQDGTPVLGLGGRVLVGEGTTGMALVRSCWKLTLLFLAEPKPASSKLYPPLSKAEPISNCGRTSKKHG